MKVFEVDIDHVFSYTFHNALQDHILREVEFVRMKPTKDPNRFIDEVLGFYDRQFANVKGQKPRVIIRCDHMQEIRQIETVLKKRERSFIAIHEKFIERDRKEHEFQHVPPLDRMEIKEDENRQEASKKEKEQEKEDPIFWIYQYKLQEGIDDSRFQVLASFEPQRDGRALIQQIGRIIRNPDHNPQERGYVLDFSDGQQEDLWKRYLEYDQSLSVNGPRAFKLAADSGWLTDLYRAQPILTYMKYRFRTPLVLEKVNPRVDLALPRMINLRYQEPGFSMKHMCKILEEGFQDEDRQYHRYNVDGAVIYLYITFENSPLLENAYFLEPKLGLTYLREITDYRIKGNST